MNLLVHESRINLNEFVDILRAWSRDEEGQDLVEYGLLASFISIAAIATIALVGPFLQSMFAYIVSSLSLT